MINSRLLRILWSFNKLKKRKTNSWSLIIPNKLWNSRFVDLNNYGIILECCCEDNLCNQSPSLILLLSFFSFVCTPMTHPRYVHTKRFVVVAAVVVVVFLLPVLSDGLNWYSARMMMIQFQKFWFNYRELVKTFHTFKLVYHWSLFILKNENRNIHKLS